MEELMKFLEAIHPLSPPLRDHLIEILQFRKLEKKAYLLKAGHICRNIYFIKKGILRCYYLKDDFEVCSWFMKENDVVISIESFYHQQPANEYLQALEGCELWYISHAQLQFIYQHYPEFNITGRIVTQHYHQHWSRQLFSIRMQTAEERYKWLLDNHSELLLRVPAKYLATYLDIAEVTLSKIKSKML
jgi:CRP-like cAMP-binding protein